MWRLRSFLIACALFASVPSVSAQWREGAAIGVPTNAPQVIFLNEDTGEAIPAHALPRHEWHTIDLSGMDLPVDTIAVFLQGLFIITNDTLNVGPVWDCNLTATFRAPGSTLHQGNYQLQALIKPGVTGQGNGVRNPVGLWVPVINRQFEFYWSYIAQPGCGSLINLKMGAYLRTGSALPLPELPPEPPPTGLWPFTCSSMLTCLQGLVQRAGIQ